MRREFSSGGVLVRRLRHRWVFAAVRPRGKPPGVWVLPKGLIEPGERAVEAALREIEEETGARGRSLCKLGDARYWFTWQDERVFKVVSFFLVRYTGGKLGSLADELTHEVAEVCWLPLEDAPLLLAYGSEREMANRAVAALAGQDV